jgi:hypothetical protein
MNTLNYIALRVFARIRDQGELNIFGKGSLSLCLVVRALPHYKNLCITRHQLIKLYAIDSL